MDRTRTVSTAPLKRRGPKAKQLKLPLTPADFVVSHALNSSISLFPLVVPFGVEPNFPG